MKVSCTGGTRLHLGQFHPHRSLIEGAEGGTFKHLSKSNLPRTQYSWLCCAQRAAKDQELDKLDRESIQQEEARSVEEQEEKQIFI